jgi:RNA methyltransferase, TrmH family
MLSKTHAKYIQSLHHKKFRDEEGVFIAEGGKVVMELLQSGRFACKELLALPDWLQNHEITIRKYYSGAFEVITDIELEKISALNTPNQVLAVFYKAIKPPIDIKGKISLLLDMLQDPGNLGTIIRIADWFGVSTIICSEGTADIYNPKVVQSTMGSLGRVDIHYADLHELLQQHPTLKVYAAALDGKDISTIKGIKEGIIIIGNESKGISPSLIELATEKITIPKKGNAESLNAAVAAGIILSHL